MLYIKHYSGTIVIFGSHSYFSLFVFLSNLPINSDRIFSEVLCSGDVVHI